MLDVTSARLELADGRGDRARGLLESLLHDLEASRADADRILVAEARFVLAMVLGREESVRAEELARQALAVTVEGSPWTLGLHRSIADWLADHNPQN